MPIRRFDDNVYSRLEFLKAVSHNSMAALAATSIPMPRTATDSPDDGQASADADAAAAYTTDASAMDGIYILLCEDFETLYVKQMFAAFDCVQRCLSCFNL